MGFHNMHRLTVVILAASVDAENQWMKDNIDSAGGENSFIAALSDDGVSLTHYCFSAQWPEDKFASIQEHYGENAYVDSLSRVLTQLGLQRFSQQLQ